MKKFLNKFGGKGKGKSGGSKSGGGKSGGGGSRFGGRGSGNNPMFGGADPEGKSSKGKSPIVLVVGLTIVVALLGAMFFFGGYEFLSSNTSTKKDYIHSYEAFINSVSKNYMTYSLEAWEEADKDFYKLSHGLYQEYYREMSLAEKMEVGKLPIMYNIYKYKSTIEREVAGSVVENTRSLRSHLQDIISNTADIYDGSYDQRIRNILDEFKAHGEYAPATPNSENHPAVIGGNPQEGF